jgi:hypothetical protein
MLLAQMFESSGSISARRGDCRPIPLILQHVLYTDCFNWHGAFIGLRYSEDLSTVVKVSLCVYCYSSYAL